MNPFFKIIGISILAAGVMTSCREKKYSYSERIEFASHLFQLAPKDIKAMSCRIEDISEDSFLSPPILDHVYSITGVLYLHKHYPADSFKGWEKEAISIQYPPSLLADDWLKATTGQAGLLLEFVTGSISYSPSLHALYFELIK